MIRDRLVVSIRDISLSQQLQLDAELTLEKTKIKIQQKEAIGEQQKVLTPPSSANLEHIRPRRHTLSTTTQAVPRTPKGKSTNKQCNRCACGKTP